MSGIRVQLELDDGQFTTRMLHAGETIQQFNANVARSYPHLQQMANGGQLIFNSMGKAERSGKNFLGTMRDLTIVAGGFAMAAGKISGLMNGFIGDIVKVNAQFERFTVMMAAMSKAVDPMADAAKKMQVFRDMSKEVPVTLDAIMNSATKLTAVGIEPLDGTLRSLIDGVAAFGGSEEALNRATLAITQMAGKGVVQMEELRQQLGEAMPRAIELMARSMGATMPEFMKAVATGTVDAKKAIEMLSVELDRTFGGRATMLLQTFEGQMQRTKALLQDLFITAGQDGGENGFFAGMKKGLTDFNNFLAGNQAKNIAKMMGQGLGAALDGFRLLIEKAIQFQGVIERVGIAVGVFVGLIAARSVWNSALSFWDALSNRLSVVRGKYALMTAEYQRFTAVQATNRANSVVGGVAQWTTAMRPAASGVSTLGAGLGVVARFGGLAASALSGVGTALLVVGPLLFWAAEAFDLFGTKADDAVKSAKRFGVANLEQAEELKTALASQAQALRQRISLLQSQGKGFQSAETKQEIARLQNEI
jgi:tape measure domain-containing protein